MDFEFDSQVKILYVTLIESSKVFKTKEYADGAILVDVSAEGNVIGIEFLDLKVDHTFIEQIAKDFKNPQIARIKPSKILEAFI
jgi:uncharacterized protein YuzE